MGKGKTSKLSEAHGVSRRVFLPELQSAPVCLAGHLHLSASMHPLLVEVTSHLCPSEMGSILDSLSLCYKGARCAPQELACERRIRWEKWCHHWLC